MFYVLPPSLGTLDIYFIEVFFCFRIEMKFVRAYEYDFF